MLLGVADHDVDEESPQGRVLHIVKLLAEALEFLGVGPLVFEQAIGRLAQFRTIDTIEIEPRNDRILSGQFGFGLQRRRQLIEVPMMAPFVLEQQVDDVAQRLRVGRLRDCSRFR